MNYNELAKEIKLISKPKKNSKDRNHFVRIELVNSSIADVWCDKEVVDLIQTCKDLGVEPIKSFMLEKRVSEKTGEPYVAVVLKMFNNDEYFYFLPRPTNTIVELLHGKMTTEKTKKGGEQK